MSLHDVDKSSLDRGAPQTNSSDVLTGDIKAHKTISTHYATDADTNTGRLQMQNKSIIGYDGTTPVTLYGFNPALNLWGSFVTEAGTDVTTNTDLSKFIFNSSQDVFKIVSSGMVTVVVPDPFTFPGKVTATIPHGLSFSPAFSAFCSTPAISGYVTSGNLTNLPITLFAINASVYPGEVGMIYIQGKTDNTNLYLDVINISQAGLVGVGGSYVFKYYIQQETAN